MIVIKSYQELKVNSIYGNNPGEDMTDYHGNIVQVSFKVIKPATLEDYYQACKEEANIDRDDVGRIEGMNFYFVLMD